MKERAKENVQGKVEAMKEKITGATDRVSDATPDGNQVRDQARRAVGVAQETPQEVAQETVQAAKDTAQESAGEHAEDLKGSAQESVRYTKESVSA